MIDHGIERLADFQNTDKLERAFDTLAANGVSARTVNSYRARAHTFGAWASDAKRRPRLLAYNPVGTIDRCDQTADTRKMRWALTLAETSRLLNVSGPRRLFYHVALWTGLRVNEARSLR